MKTVLVSAVALIDPDGRVLLFRCQEPGAVRAFWITPGGGPLSGSSVFPVALELLP